MLFSSVYAVIIISVFSALCNCSDMPISGSIFADKKEKHEESTEALFAYEFGTFLLNQKPNIFIVRRFKTYKLIDQTKSGSLFISLYFNFSQFFSLIRTNFQEAPESQRKKFIDFCERNFDMVLLEKEFDDLPTALESNLAPGYLGKYDAYDKLVSLITLRHLFCRFAKRIYAVIVINVAILGYIAPFTHIREYRSIVKEIFFDPIDSILALAIFPNIAKLISKDLDELLKV